MATFILGSIGATMGATYGVGAAIAGMAVGAMLGNTIDNKVFSKDNKFSRSSGKIDSVPIQNSSYGIIINKIYGESRVAGNLIWSDGIKEHVHHHHRVIKSGKAFARKKTRVNSTTYSYTASFAIAICEGVIDYIEKIWADAKILASSNYNFRIYRGSEDQMPDPLIEARMGHGKTPAYRGIAYIVFENFPLTDFGNRIPNFSFHVKKQAHVKGSDNVEAKIKSICIIPGSGEFVYETNPQYLSNITRYNNKLIQSGKNRIINHNNYSESRDAELSLQQLLQTCPNLEWVAPVVGWFGNSLDIGKCKILPGVENRKRHTQPLTWQVAQYTRQTAKLITQKNNSSIYGGTINDQSIINYLKLLKSKGLKIMFYPMLFMDLLDKPWRGGLTGKASDVEKFFRGENGYSKFILHYAELVKDFADVFIIGSEMVSLTRIKDSNNQFPAVKEFVKLAAEVRAVMGDNVKITYAADWSEYHHTTGGWYHMDELWSSPNIDFIGIDAYFPLTNSSNNSNTESITEAWFSGEGFEYQYANTEKTRARKIPDPYAWKNIEWWWNNHHYNPDGKKTLWQPRSKKIWFTEYGFPSVDCCSNQPNVFFDKESRDGAFPIKSSGKVDFIAQRRAIEASQDAFEQMDFLERSFLWTWDARPYPYWPKFHNIWADSYKWSRGHWVNGKFGLTELSTLILEICVESGIKPSDVEIEYLDQIVDGLVIKNESSALSILDSLKKVFLFDIVENGNKIKFLGRKDSDENTVILENNLIVTRESDFTISQNSDEKQISQINLCYRNIDKDFQVGVERSSIIDIEKPNKYNIEIDLTLNKATAKNIANNILLDSQGKAGSYNFRLPMEYLYLQAGDVISLEYRDKKFADLKIENIFINIDYTISIQAKSYAKIRPFEYSLNINIEHAREDVRAPDFAHKIIELCNEFQGVSGVYIALWSKNSCFKPASIYLADNTEEYQFVDIANQEASVGYLINSLNDSQIGIMDSSVDVIISVLNAKLYSISYEEMLQGKNLAFINGEIIQFQYAEFLGDNLYKLSNIIRGQKGSGHFVSSHPSGEVVIFLDDKIKPLDVDVMKKGKAYHYKIAEEGSNLDDLPNYSYKYKSYANMTLPPVNVEEFTTNNEINLSWVGQSVDSDFWNDELVENQINAKYFVEFYDSNRAKIESVICNNNKLMVKKTRDIKQIIVHSLNHRGEKGFPVLLSI